MGAPSLSRSMRQGGDFLRMITEAPRPPHADEIKNPALFAECANKDGAPGGA